jgi:methylenetetrahydrofolate dehydrogenase (NADP+)/methenyltetrahydrofolate cyclohydrolase
MSPKSSEAATSATSSKLLDGKAAAAGLREEIARRVAALLARGGRQPKLVAVLVGDDPASASYVASKERGCREVGLAGETLRLPATVSEAELLDLVDRLNADDSVDGILIQLPLPAAIEERKVLERVDPSKDVDGFHAVNVGRLWQGEKALAPATPSGVIELLERSEVPLSGAHAVVVGRSNIVGKPMAGLLLRKSCTVTICHSRTRDLAFLTRQADILIAAIGKPGCLGPEHVKEGAVVIDVGVNRVDDPILCEQLYPGDPERRRSYEKKGYLLTGDVDFTRVLPKASLITPVPGGVGPLTVTMVISNTLAASLRRQGLDET